MGDGHLRLAVDGAEGPFVAPARGALAADPLLSGRVQAQTLSPAGLFGSHVRYVVPLFQRPYVWTRDDQWDPLWEDIRALTEQLMDTAADPYGGLPVPPHFLGAIVLDQQRIPAGFIATRHVVDGQQRLTTLQLLLDAAQSVVEKHGAPMDAQALRVLILNDAAIAQHPDQVYKVWPTDRDQDAFRAAMDDDSEVGASLAETRIALAHSFFVTKIATWAGVEDDPDATVQRLGSLVRALRDHLKLVVIDLEPGDNAQVIFETLNHRGSRLLAADLVKNFLFQVVESQGADVAALYRAHWRELDSDYWRQQVSQGRFYRPRIDVFLNHWLTMTLLHEVPSDRVFVDFRDHVRRTKPPISELLTILASDAAVYAQLDKLPYDSVEGRFHYRVLRAMNSGVVGPLLLWLLRWDERRMPVEQRAKALTALESWIVRRSLCRATVKDLNRLVVDLLKALDEAGPETAGDTVENYLAAQMTDSRFWPTDAMLHAALAHAKLYSSLTRPRLRMVLEALEDSMRGPLGEGQPCPRNLSVEHVMPQAWREHWGADIDGDEVAALRRDQAVHTLGNLTLVSGKLNPTLSNRPWADAEAGDRGLGSTGKRSYLLRHSQLTLNSEIAAGNQSSWTEQDITDRTAELIDRMTTIWTRPPPPAMTQPAALAPEEPAESPDAGETTDGNISAHAGKYHALHDWLRQQIQDRLPMSFDSVEDVLGLPLPESARTHLAHWYDYDDTALGRAIRDAGWKATGVDLVDERVVFARER